MNKGLWMARKNYLCKLIKKLSDLSGGDDAQSLAHYCEEVVQAYPDEHIEEAILCFIDLIDQLRFVPHRTRAQP